MTDLEQLAARVTELIASDFPVAQRTVRWKRRQGWQSDILAALRYAVRERDELLRDMATELEIVYTGYNTEKLLRRYAALKPK